MGRLTCVTAALIASSCAVLTVDVDVYKGPLANHEDVQMEQLAVMAIGARPLLVSLRNQLETDHRAKGPIPCDCKDRGVLRCYADQPYVDDPHCLGSTDARTVNAILGLYLNQGRTGVGKWVAEGREIVDDVKATVAELDDYDCDADLLKRIDDAINELRRKDTPAGSALKLDTEELKAIKQGLTRPPADASGRTFRVLDLLSKQLAHNGEDEVPTDPTQRFASLTRRNDVAEIVDKALPEPIDPVLREKVALRIVRLGQLFMRSRELIDRGLVVCLELIQALESSRDAPPNREQLVKLAIDVAVNLIRFQKTTFSASIESESLSQDDPLQAMIRRILDAEKDLKKERVHDLRKAFYQQPLEFALKIEALHRQVKRTAPEGESGDPAQFGISRGPTLSEPELDSLETTLRTFEELTVLASAFGFDRGRLEDGIETLIEKYLRARDAQGVAIEPTEALMLARQRLTTGLTHFAEKVLILVNNDEVIRSCRGEQSECRMEFVMLLESIGNSILTLDDELHHRWANEKRDPDRASRELHAAQSAWRSAPVQVIDDLVRALLGDFIIPKGMLGDLEIKRNQALEARKKAEQHVANASAELTKAKDAHAKAKVEKTKAEQEEKARGELLGYWGVTAVVDASKKWRDVTEYEQERPLRARLLELAQRFKEEERAIVAKALKETAESIALRGLAQELTRLAATVSESAMTTRASTIDMARTDAVGRATEAIETNRKGQELEKKAAASVEEATKLNAMAAEELAKASLDAVKEFEAARSALAGRSVECVRLVANDVILSFSDAPVTPTRRQIVDALVAELEKRSKAASGSSTTTNPQTASAAANIANGSEWSKAAKLIAVQPLADLPDLKLPTNPRKASDVLDQIAATLRIARIAAYASGSKETVSLERALQLADEYRSPMVYIRPPSSFLRNSAPVTSLLDNNIGPRNMLTERFYNPPTGKRGQRELEIRTAIDRQFWQNINRIGVRGTGDTTYALVKDDIGNWYVKGYTGDPEKVIKGVQSMALAASSGAMKADLLKRSKDIAAADASGMPFEAKPAETQLGKHVERFTKRYEDATAKDAADLKPVFDELVDSIKQAWSAAVKARSGLLRKDESALMATVDDAAKAPFDKAPAAIPTDKGVKQAEFCTDLLRRMTDFQAALLKRLNEGELIDASIANEPRRKVSEAEAQVAGRTKELAAAEQYLSTLEKRASEPQPPPDIQSWIASARADMAAAKSALDAANNDLKIARDELTAAEGKIARARELVRDLRRATLETVGGAAQKFADRRIDAVEDYQTALQVLGQRPAPEVADPAQ